MAVADLEVGGLYGSRFVERGHPHGTAVAAMLDVHAQVGGQHAGAHIHGRRLGQQRGTQAWRFDLDHVVARAWQGQADHFKGAGVFGVKGRQLQNLGRCFCLEQRDLAAADSARHLFASCGAIAQVDVDPFVPLGGGQAQLLGVKRVLVITLHLGHPLHDVQVCVQGAGAACHALVFAMTRALQAQHLELRLHVANRQGQQGGLARLGVQLDHAKGCGGKFGQWWHATGANAQGEHVGIGQGAACHVLELARHEHLEGHALWQGRHKAQAADLLALVVRVKKGRELRAFVGRDAHLGGQLTRHGRRKIQGQRTQRQAGALCLFALAAELGREGAAHLKIKVLRLAGDHAWQALGGNAGAPCQAHLGVVGQRALAAHEQPVRVAVFQAMRLAHGRAVLAGDQARALRFAQPLDRATQVLAHRFWLRGARQLKHPVLLFFNRVTLAGPGGHHRGAAGLEGKGLGVGPFAGRCHRGLPGLAWLDLAAHAGAQVLVEVIAPGALVEPAALSFADSALAVDLVGGLLTRVTQWHHGLVEPNHDLTGLAHFALWAAHDHAGCQGHAWPHRTEAAEQQPACEQPCSTQGWGVCVHGASALLWTVVGQCRGAQRVSSLV